MSSLNVTLTLFQISVIHEVWHIFFLLKRSIHLSTKAQIKDQKLKSPLSIERNLNKSTNGSEARKCHTNTFPSSDLFCWKLLSYSHFGRCSNTAMMNQCFGNMKQDQIWCYDDLMIWWYKDIGQWFIPCLHPKKGQRMIFSCSPWFQLPWRMDRWEGFSSSWTDLTQSWLHGSAKYQLEKKFLNM